MSADNGIYILHTKDGYRVIHAQAIGNIYYNRKDNEKFNLRILYQYFNNSGVYSTEKEARDKAEKIYKEIMDDDFCLILEYGIQLINGLDIEFPKECPPCCDNYKSNEREIPQCLNCGNCL